MRQSGLSGLGQLIKMFWDTWQVSVTQRSWQCWTLGRSLSHRGTGSVGHLRLRAAGGQIISSNILTNRPSVTRDCDLIIQSIANVMLRNLSELKILPSPACCGRAGESGVSGV